MFDMKKLLFKLKHINKTLLFVLIITAFLCLAVFAKTLFIKDTYLTVELLVSGGEWWWNTIHPPYWLGDPIIEGAAEYTIQGKKQVEIIEAKKFNEGNRKTIYLKTKLLVTKNVWTGKYRYKQTPLEVGATLLLSPNNVQLYANVIGIDGITKERATKKRKLLLRSYNLFPWQADAIHVGDQMISSEKDVHATILSKQVTYAERTVLYGDDRLEKLKINQTDPLRRDVTMVVEIMTTITTNSEVFAYYQPIKINDTLIINLPTTIINPYIIDILE